MILKPTTLQEKRAVRFFKDFVTVYGYGYGINTPCFELVAELKAKGCSISHVTLLAYWDALERMGYLTREMEARMFGVSYKFNRYAVNLIKKEYQR